MGKIMSKPNIKPKLAQTQLPQVAESQPIAPIAKQAAKPMLAPNPIIAPSSKQVASAPSPKRITLPRPTIKSNIKPNLIASTVANPIAITRNTLPLPVPKVPKVHLVLRPQADPTERMPVPRSPKLDVPGLVDAKGRPIQLDPSQEDAVIGAVSGKSLSVIGKAGTGKTTIVQAMCLLWIAQGAWETIDYRIKGTGERVYAPSIAIVAFTNQAANNIRHKIQANPKLATAFGYNVTTIHNLLEYSVEWIIDGDTGKTKPYYYPKRDANNKLNITHLVLEEASMTGAGPGALWEKLYVALPVGVQVVMLGDINQLTPVVGKSILSYALQQLPAIELLTVHRTALDNPIIRQALRCLEGKDILEDYNDELGQGVIVKHGTASKYCKDMYYIAFKKFIRRMLDINLYNPMVDMIICPYMKANESAVNATFLAKYVANILVEREGKQVHEIRCGYTTQYLAIGDRVIIEKEEGVVLDIIRSSTYTGPIARPASTTMDYFGHIVGSNRPLDQEHYDFDKLDIDAMLDQGDEERKRTASHQVVIEILSQLDEETNRQVTLTSVSDIGAIQLGYATSVHKAQGSEYPSVIVALHDTNQTQLCRESLYTALTRAQNRLILLAQAHVMRKALRNQRIKGNTLQAKIEYFNEGYLDQVVDIIPTEDVREIDE